MNDVLIYADPDDVAHKFPDELPDGHVPYWSVSGTPRQTEPGQSILFCDGEHVFARGEIIELDDGRIWFRNLECVDEELPAEPVTRGFKYVAES